MSDRDKKTKEESDWQIIKSSGCSDIRDTIKGRRPEDHDQYMVEWMRDFVNSSPDDTQAAPKPGKKK
jgi:hypothetical protein